MIAIRWKREIRTKAGLSPHIAPTESAGGTAVPMGLEPSSFQETSASGALWTTPDPMLAARADFPTRSGRGFLSKTTRQRSRSALADLEARLEPMVDGQREGSQVARIPVKMVLIFQVGMRRVLEVRKPSSQTVNKCARSGFSVGTTDARRHT